MMKKFLCLTLVLLCLTMTAVAESPSITVDDLVTITVDQDGAYIAAAVINETAQAEIDKLAASDDVNAYFGIDVASMLGKDVAEVTVSDFFAVIAGGFETEGGDVTAEIKCTAPITEGQKAVFMLGSVNGDSVTWEAYDCVGIGENTIRVVLSHEDVMKIQNGTCLAAILD